MDYPDYDHQISEEPEAEDSSSWNDLDRVLEGLKRDRQREQDMLEDLIEDVEAELERVQEVYEKNTSLLEDSIRGQADRLDTAETSAGEDAQEVRDRLARLYRDLRAERREEVENRLQLKMRKWDLERELEELKGSRLDDLV